MISTLTFIDSLSERGAPDGMICLRQVAIDIASELFPEPTLKDCRTAEETAIAIDAAKNLRREAEQAHLAELRSWLTQGRIEGKSAKTNARVTEGPFIYITRSDRDLYLQSVGLKSKVQSESTSTKSHRAANIEMNFPSMNTNPLIEHVILMEKLSAKIPPRCAVQLPDDEWLSIEKVVHSVLSALYPMPDSNDADAGLSNAVNYQRGNKLERVVSGLNDAVSDGRIAAISAKHDGKSYISDVDRVKSIKPAEPGMDDSFSFYGLPKFIAVFVSSKLKRDDVVNYLRASGYEVAGETAITTDEVTGEKCDAAMNEQPELAPAGGEQLKTDNPIDYDLLATGDQLIKAFGAFAGIDKSWFSNLKDKPRLLQARKVKGTHGRRPSPAMFCPFEVMVWLIDTKRKVGRPILPETAWRMLKSNFPNVYAKNEVASPL